MYKHPEINYQPQHPMLRNHYTVDEMGKWKIKIPVPKFISKAVNKAAKSVADKVATGILGYEKRENMTKELAKRWVEYYKNKDKDVYEQLKKDSGGKIYGPDDAKWAAENGKE